MEKFKNISSYTPNELKQAIKDAERFIKDRTEEMENDNERSRNNSLAGKQIEKMKDRLQELKSESQKRTAAKPGFGKRRR